MWSKSPAATARTEPFDASSRAKFRAPTASPKKEPPTRPAFKPAIAEADSLNPCRASNQERAWRTSCSWPSTFTFLKTFLIFPSLPITNVDRSVPQYFFP